MRLRSRRRLTPQVTPADPLDYAPHAATIAAGMQMMGTLRIVMTNRFSARRLGVGSVCFCGGHIFS